MSTPACPLPVEVMLPIAPQDSLVHLPPIPLVEEHIHGARNENPEGTEHPSVLPDPLVIACDGSSSNLVRLPSIRVDSLPNKTGADEAGSVSHSSYHSDNVVINPDAFPSAEPHGESLLEQVIAMSLPDSCSPRRADSSDGTEAAISTVYDSTNYPGLFSSSSITGLAPSR
jgi:hypothetical protein